MSANAEAASPTSAKAARVIIVAGVVAGVLDLAAACAFAWLRARVNPVRVFHTIASGFLGADAFAGGITTAMLGVALHFVIATSAAAVYFIVSRRLEFLIKRSIAAGLLYGVMVYSFMNFVVLPLSAVARRPVPLSGRIYGALIIMFFVGIPIALIVRRNEVSTTSR